MSQIDTNYVELLRGLLEHGEDIRTRNSNVKRRFGYYSYARGFPLISVRKTAWKNALREWQWFMSGSCSIHDLHPAVHPWWKPWADVEGDVLNNYSEQFRSFCGKKGCVDQIEYLIEGIKNHPYSRRNVITTWNTADMVDKETPITNCHGTVIQCSVSSDNRLSVLMFQRSVDVICGLGANWVQYWAFMMWLAHRTGRLIGDFTWLAGDVHLYESHYELARKIISVPNAEDLLTPSLEYHPTSDEFLADNFSLVGEYHPVILDKAEMVV